MESLNCCYMKNISDFRKSTISFVRKRLSEMGVGMAEAERLAGVPEDTIVKLLKGHGTTYENYVAIMKLLRYSVHLYGKLMRGGIVQKIEDLQEKARITLPERIEYSQDLQAIVVEDDRYEPRFFQGTYLFYRHDSTDGFINLNSLHPRVVKIRNGDIMITIVRPGTKEGRYNLLGIDRSAQIIQDAELDWCAKIEGSSWED